MIKLIGAAAAALALSAGAAEAAKRTITMAAVEPKGGTSVASEPFPSAALPGGEGYKLTPPDANGRWEVSAYRWEPSQVVVNQGDEVTLEIIGINGAAHPSTIDGYNVTFNVKRGQLTKVSFVADKPGVFQIRCHIHHPSMVGELVVLPAR